MQYLSNRTGSTCQKNVGPPRWPETFKDLELTKYYQVSTFILHFYSFGSLLACHNCPSACPQRAVKCFFSVTAVLSKFNSNLYFQIRKDGKILCEYICALKSKILWRYCSPVHTLAHYKNQCRRLVIDEGILLVITEFYHFGIA